MPCIKKQDASIFISLDIRLGGPVQGWIGATLSGPQRMDCTGVHSGPSQGWIGTTPLGLQRTDFMK